MRLAKQMYFMATPVAVASVLLLGSAPSPSYASDSTVITLAYQSSGWSYQEVAYGGDESFEQPSFDASSWFIGQAGFGTIDGTCSWNNTSQVHESWDPGTDMLLRHQLTIPADATNVHISGTVDNDAEVYLNGTLIDDVQSGDCQPGAIDADVPSADIGATNLLAIRATDLGSADFIDVQVSYDSPAAAPAPLSAGQIVYVRPSPLNSNDNGTGCTAGFAVAKGDQRWMLLAQHCIEERPTVNIQKPNTDPTVGIIGSQISCGPNLLAACVPAAYHPIVPPKPGKKFEDYPSGDFISWQPDTGYVPDGTVITKKGILPVIGIAHPQIGDQICHWGAGVKGQQCGKLKITDQNGWWGISGQAIGGDSGGPAYTYVRNAKNKVIGVLAVGIVLDSYYANDKGKAVAGTWVAPIDLVLSTLGFTLVNGG